MSQAVAILPLPDGSVGEVARNQIGQKLGKKGQQTRERILQSMLDLLDDSDGPPVTLTSVARQAAVRLTNLYLYFPDLGDLLLAALSRVMERAESAYLEALRRRWPDESLYEACLAFLRAHHGFWKSNARVLHMRNALADAADARVQRYRSEVSQPLIDLIDAQFEPLAGPGPGRCMPIATVLLTGLERLATVTTSSQYGRILENREPSARDGHVDVLLAAEAEGIARVVAGRRGIAYVGPGDLV